MALITDTFVLVAPDCVATEGVVPPLRGGQPTVASLQHEILLAHPYLWTQEDLMFLVHCRRAGLGRAEAAAQRAGLEERLFGKLYPCMRASALPKTYGWGVHHDARGRLAIYGVESDDYRKLAAEPTLQVVTALRTRRAD